MAKPSKRMESAPVGDLSSQTTDRSASPAAESDNASDPRDRIAMRAYELYLARGGADGGDFDDWLAAEREIGGPASAEDTEE